MTISKLPPSRPFYIAGAIFILIGLGGLLFLIEFTVPSLGPRWCFFFFGMLLFSGLALPVAHFLHRRFPSDSPINAGILVRQAVWVGLYFDLLVWLQMGRFLNATRALLIVLGLILLEYFLRLRERSQWKPKDPEAHE